ncbi:AAA family ATPase [Chryseobacterium rhizosphaerae]|uniref:AAA family ATPase n=1 Tax=Chryseobacterium rhizosphaerae TaxID=395937 RepID=UPI002359368B|nr:AAA family ATPase [Chryseobacterium rhizosphaerae]MDC8099308.1 AAA family ATPase [Chryseobacterium rhizosphaerae]
MTFTELIDKLEIWDHWQERYSHYVPLFIEEAKTGENWEDWDKEVFYEFFMRSSDQCVSSLKLGYFTHEEKDLIKENWSELSLLLQNLTLNQHQPSFETYYKIKDIIRKYTSNNKKAATNRLIAGLQPQLLCTIVNEDKLRGLIYLLNKNVEDFELKLTYDWFQDSYNLLQIFKEKLNKSVYEIVTLPWQVYDYFQEQNTASSTEQNDMSENKLDQQIQILEYKKQIILQGPPGTGKTRMAKELAVQLLELNNTKELKNNPQFKLIQFHPSYSYEDFVRGIVAKPNPAGQGVLYVAENKTLGEFAQEATDNYNDSKKAPEEISKEHWIQENYEKFKEFLATTLEERGEVTIKDNTKPKIIAIEEKAIRVNRYSNENDSVLIKDTDIIEGYKGLYLSHPTIKIKENTILSKSARSGMYYLYQNLVENFKKYLDDNHISFIQNTSNERQELKPYVLVIDEINRANLSSVLGELIYALEYRGEAVNSMYEVEDSILSDKNHLILPPNLYIIGTMNTADRSVGHIDYAIRRRFAFIEVLPEPLEDDDRIHFNTEGFKKVSELFKNGNVSGEFEAKDVQLGHSYFIAKHKDVRADQTKEDIFRMKMNYEVVPILLEYVKDGVLIGTFEDKNDNNKEYDIKDYINTLKINN